MTPLTLGLNCPVKTPHSCGILTRRSGGLEDSRLCGRIARRKHFDMTKRTQSEFAGVQHSIRHAALRKGRSIAPTPDCHGRDHHIIGRREHVAGSSSIVHLLINSAVSLSRNEGKEPKSPASRSS
jgi:hypothetical protein